MEFCPKCGTILVPNKVSRSTRLICPRCGYKGKVKKPSEYKINEKGKQARDVVVIVEKKPKGKKPVVKEYEIEPPEYDEEMYD